MTTLALKKDKSLGRGAIPWTAALPFIENKKAVLIHRPRHITTHTLLAPRWGPHMAIACWCGNTMTGTTKFTFLDAPPEDSILCARCEDNAVANGLPSASELAGRHVHTGGVVAVKRCCKG